LALGGSFHVKEEFGSVGWMHTYFNGNELTSFSPYPSSVARDSVRETMNSVAVAFASTQWTGWVPGPGTVEGDLENSQFSITNMKVCGSVVFGPEPPKCPDATPAPPTAPEPSPSPAPSCDCSWASQWGCDNDDGSQWGCGHDDGSCCFSQCCGLGANSTEVTV